MNTWRNRRLPELVILAGAVWFPLFAVAQSVPDPERGRALYENHCQVCHTSRVHTRVNRLPMNREELREIVDRWQREERLSWSGQEVTDVVEFLNRTRYGYAPK